MRTLLAAALSIFAVATQANIQVNDATVRLLPPTVPNTSVYFTLINNTQQVQTLIGAESVISDQIEIHEHVMQGDMMRMQQLQKLTIAAGESVTFESGGLHLMVFGLKKALSEDEEVRFTLLMESGERVTFNAVPQSPHSHHGHH